MQFFALALSVLCLLIPVGGNAALLNETVTPNHPLEWFVSIDIEDGAGGWINLHSESEFFDIPVTATISLEHEPFLWLHRIEFHAFDYSMDSLFHADRVASLPGTSFSKQLFIELDFLMNQIGDGSFELVEPDTDYSLAIPTTVTREVYTGRFGAQNQTTVETVVDEFPNTEVSAGLSTPTLFDPNLRPLDSASFVYTDALEVNSELFDIRVRSSLELDPETAFSPLPEPSGSLPFIIGIASIFSLSAGRRLEDCS